MKLPTDNEATSRSPAVKKAKIEKSYDDETAQKRNLQVLRDWKVGVGSISGKTYSKLIEETFPARRNFIQQEAKSCAEILDLCPYLGDNEHVRYLNLCNYTYV